MRCVDEFKPLGKTQVLKFPGLCLTLSLGCRPDSPAASLASTPGPVMVLLISLLVRYWLQSQNRRFCILLKTPPSDPP